MTKQKVTIHCIPIKNNSKTNPTQLHMSAIILVSNSAKKGKSSTLVELASIFLSKYIDAEILYSYKHKTSIDFTLIIKAKGSIVAFESQGKPNTQLEKRLETIIKNYNPKVLFCTSRTKGETLQAVNRIVNKFNYNCIKTATYEVNSNFELANTTKAKHLYYLLIQLDLF